MLPQETVSKLIPLPLTTTLQVSPHLPSPPLSSSPLLSSPLLSSPLLSSPLLSSPPPPFFCPLFFLLISPLSLFIFIILAVSQVQFSHQSKYMIVSSLDSTIRLWKTSESLYLLIYLFCLLLFSFFSFLFLFFFFLLPFLLLPFPLTSSSSP